MYLIHFNDIRFHEHFVLRGNHMEIYPGQITLLYGESGSGKTTLLKEFALKHKFAQEYKHNHENLLELSETEKKFYLPAYFLRQSGSGITG